MEALKKERKCIGIDLGTTNTTVAITRLDAFDRIERDDVTILQRADGKGGSEKILPSIIYYTEGKNVCVGYEARENKEKDRQKNNWERHYIENSKLEIGKGRKWIIDNKTFTPVDVATSILERVVKTKEIRTIIDDSDVFITVPANFDQDQTTYTELAAKKAGFKNVELYPEPKAAILSYIDDEKNKRPEDKLLNLDEKKRILVVDIGGGTCDICLQDVYNSNDSFMFEPIGTPNREDIGGIDFDQRIASYIYERYGDQFKLTEENYPEILDISQEVKEKMSKEITYYIQKELLEDEIDVYRSENWKNEFQNFPDYEFPLDINGIVGDMFFSIEEFTSIIEPLIIKNTLTAKNKHEREANKNIETLINRSLEESKVSIGEIDHILLTGGMAKCFILKAILYNLFKIDMLIPKDPLFAVSRGAALINKYPLIHKNANSNMPRSIMMEMKDGSLYTLISAGESYPVSNRIVEGEIFKTSSRTGVSIALYEGQNEYDNQLKKIKTVYKLEFEQPEKLGREFVIRYSIDKTKRIIFEVEFLDNGKVYEVHAYVKEEN